MYETYCAYEKTFALSEMQLTVSAPIANILWTGMLFFLLLIILGIFILFAYPSPYPACNATRKKK
jgi:hypothetical protein